MNLLPRTSLADAEIVVCNKGGRDFRFDLLERGEAAPREFFYGFLDLKQAGFHTAMMSTSGAVPGNVGAVVHLFERATVYALGAGARPLSARLRMRKIPNAKVVISNTDGFSLSLGFAFSMKRSPAILMGGFQGLSDIEARARAAMRPLTRSLIRRALTGLDHVFFLAPADRDAAVVRYGLAPERTSILTFGVDTEFWRPLPTEPASNFVFAIGHDQNRDFDCLAAAPGQNPTHIVTSLPVRIPQGTSHVKLSASNFTGAGPISDVELRRLYNRACAVVVPLKDVHQPSGQSVTLQAMSCGRPVILSRIRGLWAPHLLVDGENCLLVTPGDAEELGRAITRVRTDKALSERLSAAARATAVKFFGLSAIGGGTIELARRGLEMAAARTVRKIA